MSIRDDRADWRDLGEETAIDPGLPICDPHHHLWSYPDSVFLVDEFLAEAEGGHNFVSSVFVECMMFHRPDGPQALRPIGETEQVDRITTSMQTGQFRVAAGIVGLADLRLGEAVQEVLDAHASASPRFRGIRFSTAWDASDKIHRAHTKANAGELLTSAVREGFACVERSGLSFDAWMYFHQLPELIEIAQAFPGLPIVLDHIGAPIGIGPYAGRRDEVFGIWQAHIAQLARCPNVSIKLGGMAMSMAGFGWQKHEQPPTSEALAKTMAPYFLACIECFGPSRCMFESNFPMDRVSCSYTVLWNAFKRIVEDFSSAERSALFHDTAAGVYRL